MYPTRSLVEEYLVYGQAALATVHLLMLALSYRHPHMSRSYMCVTLAHFLLGVYAMVDSLDEYMILKPTSGLPLFTNQTFKVGSNTTYALLCCPNSNYALWNRYATSASC